MTKSPFARYLAPFAVFWLCGIIQGEVVGNTLIWWAYAGKILAVMAVFCLLFRGLWRDIEGGWDARAVLVGLLILVIWIPYHHAFAPAAPASFDPALLSGGMLVLALALRTLGASIITPLLEETFWRSFVMRFLIKENFLSVRLGTYSFWSFWETVVGFTIVHPMWQWPVAAMAGIAYGFYLVRSKNLWGCVIAHGTTNLGISLYAIAAGEWGLWG